MHLSPNLVNYVHFVGIGGIGMSGIAEILHNQGYSVKGSDLSENTNVIRLKNMGIPIVIGHDANNIRGSQVLVISSAIPCDNPEVKAARNTLIPIITRGEMLAEIIRLKKAIAISGMHGKTTTTSIIAALLNAADFDPTVINGGIINKLQTNAQLGNGEWFVVEADESDGSFLKLPSIINVITNIDQEHMKYFKTQENIEKFFLQFLKNLPFYGLGVVCSDNEGIQKILSKNNIDRRITKYGLIGSPNIKAENIRASNNGMLFDVTIYFNGNSATWQAPRSNGCKIIKDIFLPMLGKHNVLNTLAGIAVAVELGIDFEIMKKAFADFTGVRRRFSILGTKNGVTFVDDYAHHPSEIKAVLEAANQTAKRHIITVFQPHRYSRFSDLWKEFLKVLGTADIVIAMPVYTAGEEPIENINSETFIKELAKTKESYYAQNTDEVLNIIKNIAKEGDLVIGMGAGSISEFIKKVYEQL
jgi:UDP-N-acetylmuramate--alanine ligase